MPTGNDSQPTLPTGRDFDLPPMWDGRVVVWDEWRPLTTPEERVFICPPPIARGCHACGSLAVPMISRGRVAVSAFVTRQMLDADDDNRARLGWAAGKRKPRALYELTAFRCPDCLIDQVSDADWVMWDLDESDYSAEGSWPQ